MEIRQHIVGREKNKEQNVEDTFFLLLTKTWERKLFLYILHTHIYIYKYIEKGLVGKLINHHLQKRAHNWGKAIRRNTNVYSFFSKIQLGIFTNIQKS